MKGDLKYSANEKTVKEYPALPVEKSDDFDKIEDDSKSDTLVYLEDHRKKKIDETIDKPDRYLSRYHYDSENLDQYLELCPHCRKPNLYTYRRVVIDSALNYLEEKEERRVRYVKSSAFLGMTAGLLVISGGLYYLIFHLLSGPKV